MTARFYEGRGEGAKRSAPAALRNREPIAEVLRDWLPATGTIVDIASGSGEQVLHFARVFPNLQWQPSDIDAGALGSIAAWREEEGLDNLLPPLRIDTRDQDWGVDTSDALFCANMVHISPWASAEGLVGGAGRLLGEGGRLILYGPWLKDDIETAPGNIAFDSDLKARNAEWGLRRVEDFAALAETQGFALVATRAMPANNLMLLLEKGPATGA